MSVKVGVRVRPFNKRQEQLNCRRCIQMNGTTTHLINSQGQARSFIYDYSFWSHDKFMVDPDGIYIPVDEKYADQRKVYEEIGSDILDNSWKGYNCCLFAYGQTGSGKSYSMLGYGENKGIIPLVCDEIFEKIKKTKDQTTSYDVKVSMMEIYNEAVRDLLSKNKKSELKICQHKKIGVYVEGLEKHTVKSYKQIEKKIDEGSNNRSIAATLMNESSSRSHTIVTISFIQKIQVSSSKANFKYSTINLVDLAGSQCVGKTGVDSKDRLRETAKINQSLSTLGRVIQILAQNASKIDKMFVPYRDSKLTFILRNALGGNSCTAMICAISPADDNYEETLSTLRYAHRAKKIQNKAVINESDVDKLIRMLREQNEMLKKMLQQAKFTKTVINQEIISNVQQINRNMQGFGISTDDDLLLDELDSDIMPKDISFNESNISFQSSGIDEKLPYLTNISEDQQLSGRLKYSCVNPVIIGNKQADPKPDIILAALGIQSEHAKIHLEDGRLLIQTFSEKASEYTFVNGENVLFEDKYELYDLDRLIVGTGCVFMVKIYGGKQRQRKDGRQTVESDLDYAFAISELQEQKDFQKTSSKTMILEQEELRKQILSEIQKEYEKEREENQKKTKQKIEEQERLYKTKLQQIEMVKQLQNQRLKQQLASQAFEASRLKQEKHQVQVEIQKFQEVQKSLVQTNQEKELLQENKKKLQLKVQRMSVLEKELDTIQGRQTEMKDKIQKQEVMLKKQLQVKMIMCNNENILNQYKLQLSKKSKNANEVRDLLVKKQRIQLQKQLLELVPMVEKFNLIGRQMEKQVYCGLSIKYKYFSETQTVEVLKTGSYKNKLQIVIHVIDRKERRSYNWSVQVFKNRFQLALSMFEIFLRRPSDPQINNQQTDPYWDPPLPQLIGTCYLSLETLFYGISFKGLLSIVKHGEKIGTVEVNIFPTDNKGKSNLSQTVEKGIKLYNPKQWIERTINFYIILSNLKLNNFDAFSNLKLQYELFQKSYKTEKYSQNFDNAQSFNFIKMHTIKDLSEAIILHHLDKPLNISLYGTRTQLSQFSQDTLTMRGESFCLNRKPSEEIDINPFTQESPSKQESKIVTNYDIMSKINLDYEKKMQEKRLTRKVERKVPSSFPKKSKDNCEIF